MNEQETQTRQVGKWTVKVGDFIDFEDAKNAALGHGHDVIGFDGQGLPLVECDGQTLTVKPEQIRQIFRS